MKRILQVVGTMNRAGAEMMVMNLYKVIDRSQYQFEFVYFTSEKCSFDEEIESMGGAIHRIPEKYSKSVLLRTYHLYKLIKREGPFYAVHCHQLFSNAFHLIASFFAGTKKRIAHSHNTSDVNSKSLFGRMYQHFSRSIINILATDFIACGEEAGKFLFNPKKRIVFIPNAIDINKFLLAEDKRSENFFQNSRINKDTLVLSQIGRFMPVKNHEFSINLALFLKEKEVDFHLFFAGSGRLEDDLKKQVLEKGLSDHITFLGVRKDVEMILVHTDIMLMPSLHEGFPVILVESHTAGTPSLVSENITKEVDMGMKLLDFCSLDATYQIWLDAINVIIQRPAVSREVRRKVITEKGFDIDTSVKFLEKVYN